MRPSSSAQTGRLFAGLLPDNLEAGTCTNAVAPVPLYRLWSRSVNHRYTTSLAIRSQMIEQGYVPEGYGPLGVAMCVGPDQ